MGFGLLFIGYFFLVNISYFSFTDIIGAMVMLSALYKLSGVNRHFKNAFIADAVFAGFALIEFLLILPETFGFEISLIDAVSPYISALRYCIIFVLNIFILRGIEDVAIEVEAAALSRTARASLPLDAVYLFASLFSVPFISSLLGAATAYIYFAVILAIFVYVLSNLVVIYKAYMQICMPGDETHKPKSGKGGALDKFYDSIEAKGKEYAENRAKRRIERAKKKKAKKK